MKKLAAPTPYRVNLQHQNVNRMDPIQVVVPAMTANPMNPTQPFPRDFFPMLEKKYSIPSHIYKHVFVTSPSKIVMHKKRKKSKEKEESWFDSLNPFGCESDEDDYEDSAD